MAAAAIKPRVVYTTTLQVRLEHHMANVCAILGCNAIEARALWDAGDSTVIAEVEAGAASGDVMRLRRIPRRAPMPR